MSNLILFESKQVRRVWNEEKQTWYFAIVDVVAVLTDSPNPQVYWRVLKKRLLAEGNESVTNCNALKMEAADGKMRVTDVADAEQLFRLIQSIPSPKAEPFKRWLARVGYERLEEIENPELAIKRMRGIYRRGGANDEGNWNGIMEYFSPAVQLGLTATPKRRDNVDTYKYFGEPVYIYLLKEGINDGFLTPFKVKRIKTTLDDYIYTSDDQIIEGEIEEGKIYTEPDFNRIIEFKQIVGRGTRLFDGKEYFTIYDFVDAYHHFADPESGFRGHHT